MNILFITNNPNYTDEIVNFLHAKHQVSYIISQKDNLDKSETFIDALKNNLFDIVINFSPSLFDQLLILCKDRQVPFFQITQDIFFIEEKRKNINFLSHFIFLSNDDTVPNLLSSNDYIYTLPTISAEINYPTKKENTETLKIVINIHCDNIKFSPIYELIPFLNVIPNSSIHIVDDYLQDSFLNPNIELSRTETIDAKKLISKADIVIGNKEFISYGILLEKFCIVIGERGYGGIVSRDLFNNQYKNHFQGRIGGTLGESTPQTLLNDDIGLFLSMNEEERNNLYLENKTLLEEIQKTNLLSLEKFIVDKTEKCIKYSSGFKNVTLVLSNDFELTSISDEKFVLVNKKSQHLHSHFEKEEADIIKSFYKENSVQNAILTNKYEENQDIFIEFIKTLCDDKILVFI